MPGYKGARVPQDNFNIQRLQWATVFQIGYVGSAGRRLAQTMDYNQGILGVRPIAGYGAINLLNSSGRSSYNALWLSATRKTAKGLTFDTSFTYSKSIDITSTSGDAQIRNAYDLNSEKGLSDFDARFRFVASVLYQLPWTVKRPLKFFQDWSLGIIGNYQSGNPFSPIMDKVFPCLIRTRATGSTRLHSRSTRSTLSATLDATS